MDVKGGLYLSELADLNADMHFLFKHRLWIE
jgi:hypothetical protein